MKHPTLTFAIVLFCVFLFFPLASANENALSDKFVNALKANRYDITYQNNQFSGEGWKWLVNEGKAAKYFLLGEEHGIAENAKLAAALYASLLPSGYEHFAIETSPQMAKTLNTAALSGLSGIENLYNTPGSQAVFFNMLEEAQMLVEVRALHAEQERVFWGLDYEVLADRHLIKSLYANPMPSEAMAALDELQTASAKSWQQYDESKDPRFIFSFAGKPDSVSAVRDAWPSPSAEAVWTLNTLEQTLAINQAWISGNGFRSNELRVALLRNNFLRYWLGNQQKKVFFKFGATHMIRGLSLTKVFDLGAMLPELAAQTKQKSFHLLVLPGKQSQTAVFNPTTMQYVKSKPKDGYNTDIDALQKYTLSDSYTLFDVRPLRPLVRKNTPISDKLRTFIFGFDAVLIMTGSTASSNLLVKS